MKKALSIAIVLCLFALHRETMADSLSVSFTSKDITTGDYSPERDVVAYIVNAAGAFVRTIAYWGDDRKDCWTWFKLSSNNVVDAVSGATVKGASANLQAAWNGKNASKQPVSNGLYWLCLEGTASDSNSNAPRLKFLLNLDGTSKSSTTPDSSLNKGSTYFTATSVSIVGSGAAISHPAAASPSSGQIRSFMIGRNRTTVPAAGNDPVTIELFSLRGAQVSSRIQLSPMSDGSGLFRDVNPGIYIAKISSPGASMQRTVLLER